MSFKPLVSIIIPVKDNFELTKNCLNSLKEATNGCDYEVIVVDNGSVDETVNNLPSLGNNLFQNKFNHIRLEKNFNFAPSCNLAAKAARGKFLFFLNNDTIVTQGYLPLLLENLDGKCGAVGPLLCYPKVRGIFTDRIQHLGACCKPQLHMHHIYEYFPSAHRVTKKRRTLQFITAAALVVPRSMFWNAGAFFEGYINGGEDVELCIKIRNLGYSLECETRSLVYHLCGQTSGRYDSENINASILKDRCLSYLYPDMHLHLLNDGFELKLTENLTPYGALPCNREKILQKASQKNIDTNDDSSMLELIEREPFFYSAYFDLVDMYGKLGHYQKCVDILFLLSRFLPAHKGGHLLKHYADLANDTEMSTVGQDLVGSYSSLNQLELLDTANALSRYFSEIEQPYLANLYSRWAAKQSPSQKL